MVVVVVGAAVVGVAARFSVGDMLLLLWRPLAPAAEEGACLLSVPLAPLSLGGGRVSSVATSGDDNHPECNTMRQRYSTWTTHNAELHAPRVALFTAFSVSRSAAARACS